MAHNRHTIQIKQAKQIPPLIISSARSNNSLNQHQFEIIQREKKRTETASLEKNINAIKITWSSEFNEDPLKKGRNHRLKKSKQNAINIYHQVAQTGTIILAQTIFKLQTTTSSS